MKQLTLIFIVTFVSNCFGQGLNGEIGINRDYQQYAKGLVCVDEFSYLVEKQHRSNSYFTTCSLFKIDTLQNIVWEMPIFPQYAEIYDVHEIIPSENGGVYLLGFATPTCDLPFDCFWFIQKVSPLGVEDWHIRWSDTTCWDNNLSGLSMNSSSELLVNFTDTIASKIYAIANSGELLDSLVIEIDELNAISTSASYEAIASKDNVLLGFSSQGEIQNFIEFPTYISDFVTINDTLFVLTTNKIYSYHSDFTPIFENEYSGFNDFSNLHPFSGNLSFLSHDSDNQTVLSVDHGLQLLSNFQIPAALNNTDLKDFNLTHLSVASNFTISLGKNVIRHRDFSLNSSNDTVVNWTDIGILDINPTQIEVEEIIQAPGVYQFAIFAEVLIKNYGTTTLNECRINHKISDFAICGEKYFTELFADLYLEPGDSMWVEVGMIHFEVNFFPSGLIQRNICVYTSHPNYKTDLIVPNDLFCKNIVIGHTAIDEIKTEEAQPIKIVDILGRETEEQSNSLQIHIYQDGTVKKVFRVE